MSVPRMTYEVVILNAPLEIHHDNDYGWWENQE